ncbi:MAG: Asp23/Gls24 family envelope stress response protein [Lachnospiraceae bacterium]|nr:Asp23/Gls24 family envelope stress response protein [Lachnospiraceae bacterium]
MSKCDFGRLDMENKNVDVKIALDVLAVIAGLAATEVDGVAALSGGLTHEHIAKQNAKGLSKGINLNVEDKNVRINMSIVMKYGYNVKDVCGKVQDKVRTSLENMTGFNVTGVNINVSGLED